MPPLHRRSFIQAGLSTAFLPLLGCDDRASTGGGAGHEVAFREGIASGDPLQDRVMLWTRAAPESGTPEVVPLEWVVALDPALEHIVLRERAVALRAADYTVKLDVLGLQPGTTYYFRFTAGSAHSPVGRTRTLPVGAVERLRLGVVACSDYQRGFYNAYARLAERNDLDAVLHLGDYIYERQARDTVVRQPDPADRDTVTVDEYRRRYRQARQDPDLQSLHRQHPMIWVWDDHEFANDAWRDGASRHDDATQGPWLERRARAVQVALEYLPIRSPEPSNPLRIYRSFRFGDLIDLNMLDTRIIGRDAPVPENTVVGDNLPAFTQTGAFADPQRQLLGAEQESWLFERLRNSSARWRFIGQQVMMAQVKLAGLPNALGGGVFGNIDQWDGYQPARDRLFTVLREAEQANTVVLSGDFHVAFASDLTEDPNNPAAYNALTGEGALAAEFVTTSVSSAGDRPPLTDPDLLTDPGDLLEELVVRNPFIFRAPNPHIKFSNSLNGYTLLDITAQRVVAEFWSVPVVGEPDARQNLEAVFRVDHGTAGLQAMVTEPLAPPDNPSPPAPTTS